jgi:para-aminobenzoate synthetase/4-amino-4-deoxychorismate lyase
MKPIKNNEVLLRGKKGDWLYFCSPVKVIRAYILEDVMGVLTEAADWDGWAVGYVGYEAASAFDVALSVKKNDKPLAWFGLYDAPERVDIPAGGSAVSAEWISDTDKSTYSKQINLIKDHIMDGDTYQVNHTIRLKSHISDAWKFFLNNMSEAEFSVYMQTDDLTICSASPELFFDLDGDVITCRPMKGTGRDAHHLALSIKDRTENIMIVDMIRNDLGHICSPGSIIADPLFTVQPFDRIWQMTSTVKGKTDISIPDIFKALFPCASITGAPKCRTMQIIKELENSARGVYCGAIGYMAPGRKSRFSVAIRTAEIDRRTGDATYGVGGGIVWDSQPASEWNECALKTEILGGELNYLPVGRVSPISPLSDFQLLETMLYDNGIVYLNEHIQRLTRSAAQLGFNLDISELVQRLSAISGPSQRLRLLLSRDGIITLEAFPFIVQQKPRCRIALSCEPVDSDTLMLYHKTTCREIYNKAKDTFPAADDVILWNTRGEVTESTIANVVARIDGKLVTPPLSCGLLPGTMRAALLQQGKISERVISLDELREADEIFLINSLRGWMPAEFLANLSLSRKSYGI